MFYREKEINNNIIIREKERYNLVGSECKDFRV
jgi:hypothetical protein